MAKIPGWAYVIVGGAIAAYSWYIRSRAPSKSMTFFIWVGIIIFIVGVAKISIGFMTGDRKKEGRPPEARDYIICPRCNAKLDPRSRFCNWCGTKQ